MIAPERGWHEASPDPESGLAVGELRYFLVFQTQLGFWRQVDPVSAALQLPELETGVSQQQTMQQTTQHVVTKLQLHKPLMWRKSIQHLPHQLPTTKEKGPVNCHQHQSPR